MRNIYLDVLCYHFSADADTSHTVQTAADLQSGHVGSSDADSLNTCPQCETANAVMDRRGSSVIAQLSFASCDARIAARASLVQIGLGTAGTTAGFMIGF